MARIATGAITITDITDGTSPISVFLSNENHSFPATEDGAVQAADIAGFSTLVNTFIGTSNATYDATSTTDAAMSNNTYRIAKNTGNNTDGVEISGTGWPTGSNWSVTDSSGVALVSGPSTALADTSDDSATATINVRVKNSVGGINSVALTVTLTKSINGSGSDTINLVSSRQTFTANNAGTLDAAQTDIILEIATAGDPGAQQYFVSEDGAAYAQVTTASSAEGGIEGFSTDGSSYTTTGTISTSSTHLRIDQTNLGSLDTLSIKVTGSSAALGQDSVSIIKIRAGADGEAAILVVIESSNDNVFKNSAGSDKTLTCKVYDAGTGSQISDTGITFTWRLGDSSGSLVEVASGTRNVNSGSGVTAGGTGATYNNIVVDASDVSTSQQYTCSVSVA